MGAAVNSGRAISQGSITASGERLTQAPQMPADTAPSTSKGLPETSQASAGSVAVRSVKKR